MYRIVRRVLLAVLLALAASSVILAQTVSTAPPKPGPEHQKLAGLVGTWTTETYKTRFTLKGLGTDKFVFVGEYSEDGKVWKAFFIQLTLA